MEIYFVDYENVNTAGLNGLTRLTEEDLVVIFYSEKADRMTFGLHRRLNDSKAEIRFQRIISGTKNALDFQLSSYMGYLICENTGKEARYYIVSTDQGYAVLSEYWKRQKVEVYLVPDISHRQEEKEERTPPPRPAAPPQPPQSSQKELERRIEALLPDRGMAAKTAEIIEHARTQQDVYLALWEAYREKLDDEGFARLYRSLRPVVGTLPSQLEETLERLLPDREHVALTAKIIRTQKTKDGVRLAMMQEYRQAGGDVRRAYETASRAYAAVEPLIIGKPNAGEEPPAPVVPTPDDWERRLRSVLSDRYKVQAVAGILRNCATRQEINTALWQLYRPQPGDRTVTEILNAIRPLIADLPGAPETVNTSLENKLRELLPDRSMVPEVARIIRTCASKTDVNAALMKAYPSPNHQVSAEIYRTIKPLLSGKK